MADKLKIEGGYVETESGIIVPPGYVAAEGSGSRSLPGNSRLADFLDRNGWNGFSNEGFSYGYRLNRDDKTMVIRWAEKGSGIDDMISAAFADGTVANVGITPVPFPQIPGILQRQISQASSSSISVTATEGIALRARSAISRFNDSPVGFTQGIQEIVYRLRTFNRGSPIASIPITYPAEKWESLGIKMVEMSAAKKGQPAHYYLEVDWRGKTPVPYLPNPFDLEPTGNSNWPYWFRTTLDGKSVWVLLHSSQIIPLIPGVSNRPGLGTSSIYMCLGFLGEHALALDARHEKQINAVTDGFLTISGVSQSAQQIRKNMDEQATTHSRRGNIINKGHTVLTSPNKIEIGYVSFRREDGVDFEKRRIWEEDVLALCFEVPLVDVVTRGGVGYGTQSNTASELSADVGVTAVLSKVEIALGAIYTRSSISVTRLHDRARRLNTTVLKEFGAAISSFPEGTFTTDEIRTLINQDILTIPDMASGESTRHATTDNADNNNQQTIRNEVGQVGDNLFQLTGDARTVQMEIQNLAQF